MGWIRTSKNNFCGVKAKKVFEITDKFSWKYFYMTGPGVVNIYHQACFLVLFWVHEYTAISWYGKYRNWRYEWTALIRTDHVYCTSCQSWTKTDAVSVNLLIAWLMLRWAHLSTSLVGHESLEVDILQYLTITLGKRERTRTWKTSILKYSAQLKDEAVPTLFAKNNNNKNDQNRPGQRGSIGETSQARGRC